MMSVHVLLKKIDREQIMYKHQWRQAFIFPYVQTFLYKYYFQDKTAKIPIRSMKNFLMSHKNSKVSFSFSVYVHTTMSSSSYFSYFSHLWTQYIEFNILSRCKNYFQMSYKLNCLFVLWNAYFLVLIWKLFGNHFSISMHETLII